MNEGIVAIAFAVGFISAFIVGWQVRNVMLHREYARYTQRYRQHRDPSDSATGVG